MSSERAASLCVPVIWMFMLLWGGRSARADEATRARFLKEYPAAAERVEAVYRKLDIKADVRFEGLPSSPETPTAARMRYIAQGGRCRIDREFIDGDRDAVSFVADGASSFHVIKNEDRSAYVVQQVGEGAFDWPTARMMVHVAFAPYCIGSDRVSDLLGKKGFVIEDVGSTGEGADERVTVRWRWDWEGNPTPSRSGEATFWPGGGWVLTSYRWRQKLEDGSWQSFESYCDVKYEGGVDAVALVSKVETGWRDVEKGTLSNVARYTIESAREARVPDREFTLAAFGLGFASEVPRDRTGPTVLVVLGVVGLVLAVLASRVWSQRQARPDAG